VKVRETFEIGEPRERLWEFFEQVDRVAWCVPGVEDVSVVDAENSRLRVTQTLGPLSATFDTKMKITSRDHGRSIAFTAVGRSVAGAAGNVRATNTVTLEDVDQGATRVIVEADVALGGMLGAVGGKVVERQAKQMTTAFAGALQHALGDPDAAAATPAGEAAEEPEEPEAPAEVSGHRGRLLAAIGVSIVAIIAIVSRRRR